MKKLLEWVLSQFNSSIIHYDLRNIMLNLQVAMWCFQVWIPKSYKTDVQDLLVSWSVNFAVDEEHEKLRI